MANFRIPDHIRRQLAAADSPTTFPGMQPGVGLSPVTDITLNLSGTTLGSTPRRRLSLSSLENTPTPCSSKSKQLDLDPDRPSNENRLLKNAVKLSNSNGGNFSRSRGFSRRINVNLPASPLNFDKCSSTHNDKENMGCGTGGSSTGVAPEADILPFSQHNSPSKQIASPSKFSLLKHAVSPLRQRHPLEDQDPNSQDSGYGAFLDKDEAKSGFRFAEPSGLAPRKFSIEQSPRKENSPLKSPRSKSRGHLNPPLFHSLSSGSESADDGFTDLLDLEKVEDGVHLPSGISSLLSGPIIRDHTTILKQNVSPKDERPRSSFQRSQSLIENHTPSSSKVRSCLFKSASSSNATEPDAEYEIDSLRSFKRPEPPCEIAPPMQSKRRKSSSLHSIGENVPTPGSSSLQRSFSESEATIKRALLRSSQIPDLIGDFSRPFLLPLMEGRHQDLKTISADTLASLMSGDYDDEVESYSVIDCRYPYEFDGGHIKGAKNIYTKEQIFKEFVDIKPAKTTETTQNSETNSSKRNILIFHCEFSSERGPNMFRFLRKTDRDQNGDSYPALNYPELYLLHGGYKTFFEKHSDKCEPCAYRPMLDPNHETDLRHFRSKSKSWNGDSKSRQAFRNTLKRLGL